MVCLYITSVEAGAGKTTICAGLGRHLLGSGKKVAFFKPVLSSGEPAAEAPDTDALFMKQILSLDEPVENICPVFASQGELPDGVKKAFSRVAAGRDVVITEGVLEPGIIEALDARVIAVEAYSALSPGVSFVERYKELGKRLAGIVLNKVPAGRLEPVRAEMSRQLKGTGIESLGVLPEDRTLFTLTVGELAECVQGELLNSAEQSAELIEGIMVGAMTVDPGPLYFSRQSNKAVLVRSNRPDMQLAALETATRCLILCGDTPPTPAVVHGAETKRVPIILTGADVTTTVNSIEQALDRSHFRQEKKLPRLTEIMKQHFNPPAELAG